MHSVFFASNGAAEYWEDTLPLTLPARQLIAGMLSIKPADRWPIYRLKEHLKSIPEIFLADGNLNSTATISRLCAEACARDKALYESSQTLQGPSSAGKAGSWAKLQSIRKLGSACWPFSHRQS